MTPLEKETDFRHPIRVVAGRTGLTPAVLRAWERRYDAVRPGRSDAGQRRYSDAQIARLALLKRVTDAGRSIGSVAGLDDARLEALAREDAEAAAALPESPPAPRGPEGDWEAVRARAMERLRELDAAGFESVLRRASLEAGGPTFLEEVCAPLLTEIGDAWRGGELRIGHEHLATAILRRLLDGLMEEAARDGRGPRGVFATLPGERHEMGLLLAATTAALEGWRVTYLGPDLPAEATAAAARGLGARMVGISVVAAAPPAAGPRLAELREALPPSVALLVGGCGAAGAAEAAGRDGIRVSADLPGLRAELALLADG